MKLEDYYKRFEAELIAAKFKPKFKCSFKMATIQRELRIGYICACHLATRMVEKNILEYPDKENPYLVKFVDNSQH